MESLSDTQFIDLGIRGVQRRIRGARYQILATHIVGRLFAIGMVAWIAVQFTTLIDFSSTTLFPEGYLINTLTIVFLFFLNIALILFSLPLMIFLFAGADANAILYGVRAFITVDLFNNVEPPAPMTSSDMFSADATNLFYSFAYLFNRENTSEVLKAGNRASILVIILILLIITLIAFLVRADMRSAAASFILIQLVVFYSSTQLFFSQQDFRFTPTNNIGELFSNDVVLIALASYLFLEIALQISYISQILNPAQSRQQRVLRALDRLKDFRLGITSSVTVPTAPIREETTEDEDEGDREATRSIGSTGSSIARKFGIAGMTYFIEKASDSLFARPGGQQDKLTARLQRYHDGLVSSDPRTDDKLVGASIAVQPLMTLVYVLVSVVFRVGIMLGGLYAILNPDVLLFVLRYPPSVYNSLEMLEPEGVVLLLIPIVVIILLLTSLIGFIQERFSKRFEEELEPVLEDLEYLEGELKGVITEGELEPISEEDLFYEQLSSEFEDKED